MRTALLTKSIALAGLCLATMPTDAANIVWTNIAGGSWKTATNWSPNKVPGGSDNAVISRDGTYTVTVNANASVGNLTLGGGTGTSKLSITAGTFKISTNGVATVLAGALFYLAGGILDGDGRVSVAGTMNWTKGEIRPFVSVAPSGQLNVSSGNLKFLSSGILDNEGATVWSDNGTFQLGIGSAITNRGMFEVQNDLAVGSTNKAVFVNQGTLRKVASSGLTTFGAVELRNSGTIELQTGGLELASGKHSFSNGSRVIGPGSVSVSDGELALSGAVSTEAPLELNGGTLKGIFNLTGDLNYRSGSVNNSATITGTLNVLGGNVDNLMTVNGAVNLASGQISGGLFTLNGNLNWTGGTMASTKAVFNGNIDWSGGALTGNLLVQQGRTLAVTDGALKQINGGTLTNRGTARLEASSNIKCDNASMIYNYASFLLANDTPFTAGATTPSRFYNYGSLVKAGPGQLKWEAIELHNRATVEVQAGILALGTRAHSLGENSAITGSGRLQMLSGTLALGTKVSVAQTLEILDGALTASGTFNGNIEWTKGSLAGVLTIPATRQLHLTGNGTKTFTKDSVLNVAGATLVDGNDSLLFFANATINNTGTFEFQTDGNFTFNGSEKAWFNNAGTLRKTVSTLPLVFGALQLINRGTLDLQVGPINFTANSHLLDAGTQVTGPGALCIAGATVTMAGTIPLQGPLQLVSGILAGNPAINGQLAWSGGDLTGTVTLAGDSWWAGGNLLGSLTIASQLTWTGGSLVGTLNVSASGQLDLPANVSRVMSGVLNNSGRATLAAGESIEMNSAARINNAGLFECSSTTPWTYRTGNRPVFNNTGTFRKLGTTTTSIGSLVQFIQAGTLEAVAGTVSFSAGAHNFNDGSILSGPGLVQVGGATVNIAGNVEVNGPFTLNSGLVSGIGCFDGNWTWSGGAIAGTLTHKAGNTLLITGSLPCTFNQDASLLNAGTVILESSKPLTLYDRTTINNSGLFEWRGNLGFALVGSAKPVFINSGTLRKTVATATLAFDVIQLQNSGVLDIQAGVISFPALEHTFSNGSRAIGSAIVRVSGATVTLAGTVTFDAPFEFTAGTLLGNATVQGNMSWSGGVIPGGNNPAVLTITSNLNWTGGQLLGTLTVNGTAVWVGGTIHGTFNIPPGTLLTIPNGGNNVMTGFLNNNGRVSLEDPHMMQLDSGAQINNAGVFEAYTGTPWKTTTGNRPVFNNTGTFRKLGNGLLQIPVAVEFRHYGTLEVTTNVLSFIAGAHTFFNGSKFTGNGLAQVDGASINFAGNIQASSPFTLLSGLATGAGSFDGNWTWSGGTVSGTLTNKAGNQISMSGNALKTLDKDSTLFNAGTLIVAGSGAFRLGDAATVNNVGLCEWRSAASFSLTGTTAKPRFINSGTFRKTVSTAEVAFDVIQLQNSGLLDVQAGVLSFPANAHTFSDGSRVTGTAVVRVSGATVTLAGTVRFDAPFEFTAGTLQGTATLQGNVTWSGGTIPGSGAAAFTVNGNLSWSGGTLSGSLTENGTMDWSDGIVYGTLLISTSSQLNILNGGNPTLSGTLTNAGQATTVGNASLTVLDKSLFVNRGLLEAQFEKPFTFSGSGNATLINSGTLRKTVSTKAMDFSSVVLQNSGTLDLQSGDVTFSANSHSFANGTRTMGPGNVRVNGGTLNLGGTSTMDAPFELASGILAGTATIHANSGMTWSGGTIPSGSSAGAFTVNGNLSWTAGTLNGSLTENGTLNWSGGLIAGTLSIPAASRLNVLPPGNGSISGLLQNAGTVVVSNNASILLLAGTPIVNSGVLEVQNELALKPNGTTKVTIINSGTLRKSTSTKLMKLEYVLLQNSGTLDVQAGELCLALNDHNFADGTRTTGSGAVRVTGATLNVAGNLTVGTPFELAAGTIQGGATITGNLTCSGGTILDPLRVNGPFTWTGGLVKSGLTADGAAAWSGGQLEGTFTTTTNGTFNVSGNAPKLLKGTLNNNGSVTLAAAGGLQNNGGTIQNYGVFNLLGDSAIVTVGGGRPVLNNYAVLNLTNGFARFNLGGDYQQFPSGVLNMSLEGKDVGTSLNQLVGLNKATLAGALNVLITTNYAPALGDRLEIIKCAERVGTFAAYSANTPKLSPEYNTTNVTLLAAAPSITGQPQSQTVSAGSIVSFNVQTYGTIPMDYQWFTNNVAMAQATNATLMLTNVQPAQEASYVVTISNVWGSVTSAPATLTVIIPPAITTQPAALTVKQGDIATFAVQATGTHLSYRWKFGDTWLVNTDASTLVLNNVTAAQAGKYKVEVSNEGGTVTSTEVMLTVIVPPAITSQPQSKNVNAGSDLTLSVRASGTDPFGYLWVKNGVAVPGGTNESLTLRSMSANLTGSYVVIVANEAGYVISQPAVIQLNAPPQITTQPVSQSATVGSNVAFSVTATGVPAPTYQWRKNGLTIPGATSPTLLLAGVQPKDAGRYSVVAANSFGTMESAPAELTVEVPSLPFANHFGDRGVIYTALGYGRGTNFGATKEVGEPKHAGKGRATNSVWISWWAPANGIVTFSTEGSDFDTVLAVYQGSAVNGLTKVAEDDDSAGYHNAKVSFNAQAGTYYQIAVAGFNGVSGDIILSWDLLITVELLPRITQAPLDYTGNTNETVGLQVLFEAFQATAIQWYFRGQAILGATQSSLTISNLQSDKVGGYAVRLTALTGRTVVSPPGDVQINTLGYHNVAARNKLTDALDWAQLNGGGGVGLASPNKTTKVTLASGAGPARGYNGTQIFNTQGADRDAGEPNHCGVPGGASSWFVYQAPTNGLLVIDTHGSTFDTVLEVYTGNGTDFQSLTSVACDNNSGADGLDSRVIFQATGGTVYYIVVDGVDGASGTVVLNYALGQAPTISSQPQSRTAPLGGSVTVSVSATGIPAPAYQWTFNGSNITGATNASLTLTDFQAEWVGRYQVEVSNALGTVMSTNANLYLDGPLRLANCSVSASGCFGLQVIGPANTTYVIQASTNLVNWLPLATNAAPLGLWNFIDTTATNGPARFYRVLPAP